LDARVAPLPQELFRHSTHAFGVADAVELARALDRLPPRLILYGIEGGNFAAGVKLSLAVEQAACATVERILDDLQALFPGGG
jgi:hydrogenase maturation protease